MQRKMFGTRILLFALNFFLIMAQNEKQDKMSKNFLSKIWDQLSGRALLDSLTRRLANLTDHPLDISGILETLRPRMHQPQNLLGIPALEPFKLDKLLLNENSEKANVNGEATNVIVRGLSRMRARRVQLRPLSSRVDFELLFPELAATGDYRINGSLANSLSFYGAGPFTITVKNLNATGFVTVTPSGDHLKVKDVFVEISLTSLKADLQGLLGGGEKGRVLSELLSDAVPRLLEEQRAEASRYLSAMLRRVLDDRLSSLHAAAWARAYRSIVCAATVGLVCGLPA